MSRGFGFLDFPHPHDQLLHRKIDALTEHVVSLSRKVNHLMPTVDDILAKANATLAAVQANTSLDQSIAALVDNNTQTIAALQAQLQAAGTDPAKLQQLSDVMDQIQAAETSNGQIVAAKVLANTPAAPAAAAQPAAADPAPAAAADPAPAGSST